MSKVIRVNSGNYKVQVPSGNTITLDTGSETGAVVLTGDLTVQGNTTTVNSENLDLKDNIITLNKGESGAGVTLNVAGIEIDRGTEVNSKLLYDETLTYADPVTQTTKNGSWHFVDHAGATLGIRTNSIHTGGGTLNLINSGTGVVSVAGTNDYENQVINDDVLTNKKYVDDAIVFGIQNINIQKIQRGDTSIEVIDDSVDGGTSALKIKVNNSESAIFRETSSEIENILFENATITTTTSATDLTLSSNGTDFVKLDGVLKMPNQASSKGAVSGHLLVYGKTESYGDTGVYYTNANGGTDELINTNRSILYSMLF